MRDELNAKPGILIHHNSPAYHAGTNACLFIIFNLFEAARQAPTKKLKIHA